MKHQLGQLRYFGLSMTFAVRDCTLILAVTILAGSSWNGTARDCYGLHICIQYQNHRAHMATYSPAYIYVAHRAQRNDAVLEIDMGPVSVL